MPVDHWKKSTQSTNYTTVSAVEERGDNGKAICAERICIKATRKSFEFGVAINSTRL